MADDSRGALAPLGSGLLVLAVVFAAWRSLRAAPTVRIAGAASPEAQLQALVPYLSPIADTVGWRDDHTRGVVVTRDPFVAVAERPAPTEHVSLARPAKVEEDKWTVSAVLITASRRAAVINDVLVTLGGQLPGGSRLTVVEPDHVVLTDSHGVRHSIDVLGGAE